MKFFTPIGYKTVKSSIVLNTEEFEMLLKETYGFMPQVEYSLDGLFVGTDEGELPVEEDLSEKLGRRISTIHLDDCDCVGIWITFEDETNEKRKE